MSYICLMVNDSGAVTAADTRETFSRAVHLNWRRKSFALPEKRLVWACCGPSLRFGVNLFRGVWMIFRRPGTVDEQLKSVTRLVRALTRVRVGRRDNPGVFCLLAAQWEAGGCTVWNVSIRNGKADVKKYRPAPGTAVSLHAGAYHQEMPPLAARSLAGLSYEQLCQAAEARVELAIRLDTRRKRQNRRHNQTIGGRVQVSGVRSEG